MRTIPAGRFTVLVIDDTGAEDRSDEPFAVLSPYDIGLERAEVHRMAFIYDVKEFATAVKPWLLEHLLTDADHAVYFDPDIEMFAPLDDIADAREEAGIVLTPHTTQPLPRDQLLPSEEMLLRAGIYNLGFIAVGKEATPFLDWWQKRLARDCIVDVEQGIFVDQRWIDFVPALFEHTILDDTAYNVAYWNLTYRHVALDREAVRGQRRPAPLLPLQRLQPRHDGAERRTWETCRRILLEDQPDVRRLCESYADRLYAQGFGHTDVDGYRFDTLPNGFQVDGAVRRDVREALLAAEKDGCEDGFLPRSVRSGDGRRIPRLARRPGGAGRDPTLSRRDLPTPGRPSPFVPGRCGSGDGRRFVSGPTRPAATDRASRRPR